MMKKILFLFLGITFTHGLWSQGITKYGEVPVSSVNFVNKHGKTGSTAKLSVNGKELNAGFICGNSMIINHVTTGGVAPVDKTVTYGTVSTTLFGGTKCAITQNLGATSHASSATDNTEAAGGWYWQFNQKQGYKMADDGTTRTPGNFWVNAFYNLPETWGAANDPCTLELGAGWHIPTHIEWAVADTNGSWDNYTDTYSSVLKLHAAGLLYYENGGLAQCGSTGSYWSNTRVGYGLYLHFTSGLSGMYMNYTSYGFSIRCVNDLVPILTTTAVTSITMITASSGGNVSYVGENEITARGVCWGTNTGPTVALATKTTDGSGTGTYTSSITGLTASTMYYLRAYATNSEGTTYGNEMIFTTLTPPLAIGDLYQGGIVAYILLPADSGYSATVQKGLIAALADQSTGIAWITGGSTQSTLNGHTSTAYGTGQANTNFIKAQSGYSGGAAQVCDDYSVTDGGVTYSDWYLPGKDELAKLYAMKDLGFGNFASDYYWSSSEYDNINAWRNNFSNGGQSSFSKSSTCYVRAVRTFTTLPTITTTAATSITSTTATSGGNVTDTGYYPVTARGVCWSTTTGPTVALDTKTTDGSGSGAFTSEITGLAPGTLFYARAYATNRLGTSYGNEVSFTTVWVCGAQIQKIHTAGTVAPVDKTVTYGTVTTTLFGGTKCAITQNLGATNQASSATDASEASAGWYWQFNRKQGYKHDDTTRTPSTTWIPGISENYNWDAANDPCTLELGAGWHIPTYTEWDAANTNGSWGNYTDTYNSVLKLHAAGFLDYSNGSLYNRGAFGTYWSSSEIGATYSWNLFFKSGQSNVAIFSKDYGYTARCIKKLLPTLTTTAASVITVNTATSGGIITDQGGSVITVHGVCWSTTTGPTTALTTKTTETGTTGEFTSNLTGLASNTQYYLRAYATNSDGTAYGNEVSFTTPLAIGDLYQGGMVAYILQPGDPGYSATVQHGLIAALVNQSTLISWITGGNTQWTVNGNTSTAYGTGQANTTAIMAQNGYTGGAAKVCDDYVNAETGTGVYSDWYLPSRDELNKLYKMKLLGFGNFGDYSYWSSSEYNYYLAWRQYFYDDMQTSEGKDFHYYVRAARSF